MKRNIGLHTSAEEAKQNILAYLSQHCLDDRNAASKASMGRVAYPGYDFRSPQGAAFSVAKIVRELANDGLVRYVHRSYPLYVRGYCITAKGLASLSSARSNE